MDTKFRSDILPPYVFSLVDKLKLTAVNKGLDIIDFGMGNPDNPTPDSIVEAMTLAASSPLNHRYSQSEGIYKLRLALCEWYQSRFQVSLDAKTEVIATLGAKEGLAHLALGMCQVNDTILVQDPCYPIHHYAFILAGAKVQSVPLDTPQRFLENLKKILEQGLRPKALVINFPHNPTTMTVDKSFFSEIIGLAKQYQFWVIHDFAYAEIAFDGYQPPSILSIEGAKDVAVEVYSLSKTYNMPGWRVGFLAGNPTLVGVLKRVKSYVDYGLFAPIQYAAIHALQSPVSVVDEIVQTYQLRRDCLVAGLNELGWRVASPRTTMFVWATIPESFAHMDSLAFSQYLISHAGVVVSPGIGFGQQGEHHVRFALIESPERIQAALRRLEPLFAGQNKEPLLGAG